MRVKSGALLALTAAASAGGLDLEASVAKAGKRESHSQKGKIISHETFVQNHKLAAYSPRVLLDSEVAAIYQVAYSPLSLEEVRCRELWPEQVVSFQVACGVGGRVEPLGSSISPAVDCLVDDTDPASMTCTLQIRTPAFSAQAPPFYYQCVASAENPTGLQTSVTTPELTNLSCQSILGDDFGGSEFSYRSYSRSLHLSRVCGNENLKGNPILVTPAQIQCADSSPPLEDLLLTDAVICANVIACNKDTDAGCGTTVPAIGVSVQDATVPDQCLAPADNDVTIASINERTTSTPLPAGPARLVYVVTAAAIRSPPCFSTEKTSATIRCGTGGQIGVLVGTTGGTGSDDPTLAGCTQTSASTLQCNLIQDPSLDSNGWQLEVTCQGPTLESLALEADWDPDVMTCTGLDDIYAYQIGYTAFAVEILQYCPTLAPHTPYVSYPYDRAPETHNQVCAVPSDTYGDNEQIYDWIDFDNDAEVDEDEIFIIYTETCFRYMSNCLGEYINYCDNDAGNQTIGRMVNRVALESIYLDLECQVALTASTFDGPSSLNSETVVSPVPTGTTTTAAPTTIAPVSMPTQTGNGVGVGIGIGIGNTGGGGGGSAPMPIPAPTANKKTTAPTEAPGSGQVGSGNGGIGIGIGPANNNDNLPTLSIPVAPP